MAVTIEQFAFGKLIEANRDVQGFTIVARSPNAPNEEQIRRIQAKATIGDILDPGRFDGADVSFTFGDYAIAARLQRSPRQYERGYFLQEHYLVLPRDAFAELGNNFIYLNAALPDEIPWRTQEEVLPPISLPTRNLADEAARVDHILAEYSAPLFGALEFFLDGKPIAIIPPDGFKQAAMFFEAMALLLPVNLRADLSWATNVMNAQRCQARVKSIASQGGGANGHALVRIGGKSTGSITSSPAAATCTGTLRMYRERLGVPALVRSVEQLMLADTNATQVASRLAADLWHHMGPSILEIDLRKGSGVTDQKKLFENMLPMLDEDAFHLSPEQASLFLVSTLDGVLQGVLPLDQASRIPRNLARAHAESLWSSMDQLLAPSSNVRESNRRQVLALWRQDKSFWELPRTREMNYKLQSREIDENSNRPERALERLRRWALDGWLDHDVQRQIDLLNRAIQRRNYNADLLVATWVDMIVEPNAAMRMAQAVTPVQSLLSDPKGRYTLISSALSGADAHTIDQLLAAKTDDDLNQSANLLLSVALMGERTGLHSLRAFRLIDALRRNAQQLPQDRLMRLVSLWEACLTQTNPDIQRPIAHLMMSAGSVDGLKKLLAINWKWIDTPLGWLRVNSPTIPAYAVTFELVLDWFKHPLPQEPAERRKRLDEFFAFQLQSGHSAAQVREVTTLMLEDALRGDAVAGESIGIAQLVVKFFRRGESERARRAAVGVRSVRDRLTARGALGAWYHDALIQACASAWTERASMGDLIDALERQSLIEEAQWISVWNLNTRGAEVLAGLSSVAEAAGEQQSHLLSALRQARRIAPEQITAWIPDPHRRAELKQRLGEIGEEIDRLKHEISLLRDKIR